MASPTCIAGIQLFDAPDCFQRRSSTFICRPLLHIIWIVAGFGEEAGVRHRQGPDWSAHSLGGQRAAPSLHGPFKGRNYKAEKKIVIIILVVIVIVIVIVILIVNIFEGVVSPCRTLKPNVFCEPAVALLFCSQSFSQCLARRGACE